jgi:nucleoside-diphosphate-sugar epimerase
MRVLVTGGAGYIGSVVAAQLVAAIGIGLGVLLFIIPGVYLAVRLAVVAQAATIERTDWIGALRRSVQLTRGSGWHVFAVAVASGVFNELLVSTGALVVGSSHQPLPVAAGIVIDTFAQSVVALVTAILYFDLRARERFRPPRA